MDFLAAVPPSVDLAAVALAAAVAFVVSIVGGLAGYGMGIAMPIFLAPIVGVASVIPTMAVSMMFTNLSRFWVYRRHLSSSFVGLMVLCGVPATVAGSYLYSFLTGDLIALFIGVFMLCAVPLRLLLERWRIAVGRAGLGAVAAVHGFLSGNVSGSGLIMIAGLRAAAVHGAALIGTDAVVSAALGTARLGTFGASGVLTGQTVLIGCTIGMATVPGAFVARAVLDRMPVRLHAGIMDALVVIGGCSFLWQAWS